MGSNDSKSTRWLRILKASGPLLISHHPDCARFKDHTFKIGDHRVCLGCSVIYPTIIVVLIVSYFFKGAHPVPREWYLLPTGLVLTSLKLVTINSRVLKIFMNILVGLGISFSLIGIFALPFETYVRITILIIFFLMTGLIAGYRFEKKIKICDRECEYRRDWSRCPGLRDVYSRIRTAQRR